MTWISVSYVDDYKETEIQWIARYNCVWIHWCNYNTYYE